MNCKFKTDLIKYFFSGVSNSNIVLNGEELVANKLLFPYCDKKYGNLEEQYQKSFLSRKQRQAILLQELKNLLNECYTQNITPILVKGPALSQMIYEDCMRREFGDIDVVVRDEQQRKRVLHFLKEQGYVQQYGWQNDILLGEIDTDYLSYAESYDHHEISFRKNYYEEPSKRMTIEIKKSTSSIPYRCLDDFYANTICMKIQDIEVYTFDKVHTFLALLSDTFINSETLIYGYNRNISLRDYYDLFSFVQKYRRDLPVKLIAKLADLYHITHRVERIANNLLEILHYSGNHGAEAEFLQLLIQGIIKCNYADDIYAERKDIYMNHYAHPIELIHWDNTFIDRVLDQVQLHEKAKILYRINAIADNTSELVEVSAQPTTTLFLQAYDNATSIKIQFYVQELNIYMNLFDFMCKYITPEWSYACKLEAITDPGHDSELFRGYRYFLNEPTTDAISFWSDGKYPHYLEPVQCIEWVGKTARVEITSLVKTMAEIFKKVPCRISLIRIHADKKLQEMEIASISINLLIL